MSRKARKDSSKTMKQSYMMRTADIRLVRALAKYLGVSQSEVIHTLVDMTRKENGIISKMAERLEERAKKLRELRTGLDVEVLQEEEMG